MARLYTQLTHLERKRIEEGLDRGASLRRIAEAIGRSPSTVSREVAQNRMRKSFRPSDRRHCSERAFCTATGLCGEGRPCGEGELCSECGRVACAEVCPRYEGLSRCSHLNSAPWVCNGCRKRRSCRAHRSGQWLYDADAADAAAKSRRSESRRGIDLGPEEAEAVLSKVRDAVSRGMSPYEIAAAYEGELPVSRSTIYRWVEAGYGGMCNLELERKVGFRKRRARAEKAPTRHAAKRGHARFLELDEDLRRARAEMDTVVGRRGDDQCILTLYLAPSHFQIFLLLPEKTVDAVVGALRSLRKAAGEALFSRMFPVVLTDNGAEFANEERLARAFGERKGGPVRLYYCDARASEQKGSCEKNHSELRQLLPKGRVDFDALDGRDMAVCMSHVNSTPRASLCGASPVALFKAMFGEEGEALLDALGAEEVGRDELMLRPFVLDVERDRRGEAPLGIAARPCAPSPNRPGDAG